MGTSMGDASENHLRTAGLDCRPFHVQIVRRVKVINPDDYRQEADQVGAKTRLRQLQRVNCPLRPYHLKAAVKVVTTSGVNVKLEFETGNAVRLAAKRAAS